MEVQPGEKNTVKCYLQSEQFLSGEESHSCSQLKLSLYLIMSYIGGMVKLTVDQMSQATTSTILNDLNWVL